MTDQDNQRDTTLELSGELSSEEVRQRIESLFETIIQDLNDEQMPAMQTIPTEPPARQTITKRFNLSQSRSFTSVCLVLSYCHALLNAKRTTTTREVYYFFVTHFRSQNECNAAILDACLLLQVPRSALGLKASPKGWFCGDVQMNRSKGMVDGRLQHSSQGLPITSDWLESKRNFTVTTEKATCIMVIEKEGVYNRLAEDRFFETYPCILVTGKGFPDLATRALVHVLHKELGLPVYGVCDLNPYGTLVLYTYQYGADRRGVDGGDRWGVPIQWMGLRPSQIEQIKSHLPRQVFQALTERDKNRIRDLLDESHKWLTNDRRTRELNAMLKNGYKVELEALNWLGMDYCAQWLGSILQHRTKDGENDQDWLDIL